MKASTILLQALPTLRSSLPLTAIETHHHIKPALVASPAVAFDMNSHPTRIAVYACVTDIDGCPQRRHVKLGEAFCRDILNRAFNATLHPAGYDHIHIPPDFDSSNPLKRWFILDLDVTQPLSKEDVLQLPHQVYLASHQGDKW